VGPRTSFDTVEKTKIFHRAFQPLAHRSTNELPPLPTIIIFQANIEIHNKFKELIIIIIIIIC
jgi:hypothetical protein